jgi:integrase
MDERKHLTAREVDRLLDAVKGARHEARDRCLLLLLFRHGLRVSEACGLQLSQVDVESRVLHVARLKKGLSTTHPLRGDEIRLIKAWLKTRAAMAPAGGVLLRQRAPRAAQSPHRLGRRPPLWRNGRAPPARPSPHAPPRLRLRSGRSGRGYPVHSRLSGASQHPAHRPLHRRQSGAV